MVRTKFRLLNHMHVIFAYTKHPSPVKLFLFRRLIWYPGILISSCNHVSTNKRMSGFRICTYAAISDCLFTMLLCLLSSISDVFSIYYFGNFFLQLSVPFHLWDSVLCQARIEGREGRPLPYSVFSWVVAILYWFNKSVIFYQQIIWNTKVLHLKKKLQ